MADGGRKGIEVFRSAVSVNQTFDVVITDLGMPYVDGRAVAQAVKNMNPDMPVILLTGWGQRMNADREKPAGVDQVLGKPPRIESLRAAMAELTRHGGSTRESPG